MLKAHAEAEKIIAEAKKRRGKLLADLEKEQKGIEKNLLEQTRLETGKEIDELIKQTETEKQKIDQLASKNKEKAVEVVIKEILK